MKTLFSKVGPLWLLLISSFAWANEWQANLITDEQTAAFKIDLPDDLNISELIQLAVEFDGIDVTATMNFEEGDLIFQPIEVVAAGQHTVELVQLQVDGSFSVKQAWSFEHKLKRTEGKRPSEQDIAAAENWLRSATVQSNNTLELSQRLAQHNIDNSPRALILSGAGQTSANLTGDNWQVRGYSNYFVQSESSQSLTGESVDIGEYQISASRQDELLNSSLTLGHHSLGVNSNLISQTQRRGVYAGLSDSSERVSAKLFSFRPDSLVGNSHFTGLSEPESRVDGVMATVKPFSIDHDALKITTLYYDGEGTTSGASVSDNSPRADGSGWSIGFDKGLLDGKVDLAGEYARANFNADSDDSGFEQEKSDAISLSLSLHPFDNWMLNNIPADLNFGLSYQKIDTFFASLANPSLAADREVSTAYSYFYWNRFSANIQLSHETNNVDDLEGLPTDRLRTAAWSGNYAFAPQQGGMTWLGAPYLQLSGMAADLGRKDTPINYLGQDLDNETYSTTLGGGSTYSDWYWSLSYTRSEFEDETNLIGDTQNRFTTLAAGWSPSSKLTLYSDLQYGKFESDSDDSTSYTTNWNVGTNATITEKLTLNINYNLNLAGGDNDQPDRQLINAELGWTIRTATQNNPGIAFAVRGAMENYNENSATNYDDNYQVFAVIRLTAPFSAKY
jgi:hypothetical protein